MYSVKGIAIKLFLFFNATKIRLIDLSDRQAWARAYEPRAGSRLAALS